MNPLREALRRQVLASLARDVSLEQIRHDDRPVYVSEGYGGRPIECFPPFQFYRLFHGGARDEAFERFSAWYVDQFRKYASVPKKLGGMQNGTFHRLLLSVSGGDSDSVLAPGFHERRPPPARCHAAGRATHGPVRGNPRRRVPGGAYAGRSSEYDGIATST